MPIVFTERGFRFYFYSNEGDPREPPHVHVAKRGAGDAKLWLYPEVRFAGRSGIDARTQRWIIGVVEERRAEIEKAWYEHFGGSD
ncbi:DUF4160 domain-containing protein [Sphingomonas sp.]|jgi:hypothetical protein|uniref:DUF4160 domain-containing protein n=1 Tax=Sphingomonas sp. TaxID=28214 RepID=UPI0035C81B69